MMMNILKSLIYTIFILIVACNNSEKTVEQASDKEINMDTLAEGSAKDSSSTLSNLLIEPNQFYGIKLRDAFLELQKKYPARLEKSIKKTGEGSFQIYKINGEDGAHLANIYPDQKDEKLVGQIEIISANVKTIKGIKIGNTFQDLTMKEGDVEVHGSEIEGRTYASKDGIYYRLEMNHFSYDLDKSSIKSDVKIIEIVIR
ncbi:hypothetical protein [Pedobacter cryophilus]|uniref:Lipoprotein n=1 Tax=Pedobacter cryophilus TaxID=2571271 RepID=A0A4U1BUA2_9SPHI|nr:hypothetical protein [Pedobacter cryophilus]TKB96218.1 hypothetical protein FA046_13600 [Pedobacter cryophilus]